MSRNQKHRRQRPGQGQHDDAERSGGDSRDEGSAERLQKVLAAAGVGSRRDCEELIREGRVEVDRQVVTELGTKVDPLRHEIRVDGEALRQPQTLYYAVNKPVGIVTTNFDPQRRTRVVDLVPTDERVFAVGRLDRSSEGLILVTNDGEFANRITHPRYGVEKTYLVRVAGAPSNEELQRLRKGVYLSDGFCRVQSIVPKKRHKGSTDLVIVLNEGRNRELRRILARVGHKVLRLKRIAVGPIKLADLPVGNWRRLMPNEIEALLAVAKEKRRASRPKRGPRPPKVGDSLRESPQAARATSGPPSPQPAPFSEPLSLDDLLRDDLDEGNLAADASHAEEEGDDGSELQFSPNDQHSLQSGRGGVIEYEPDQPTAPRPPQTAPRQPFQKQFKQRRGGPGRRPDARNEQRGSAPRKDFGKKRGKRVFGKPQEGKPQEGKPREGREGAAQGGENRPFRNKAKANRGGKPVGKKFGKHSGKAGGRPRRGKGR